MPDRIEWARRRFTRQLDTWVVATVGQQIQHLDISHHVGALFWLDGVHLSQWGMDTWLHALRGGLVDWLQL